MRRLTLLALIAATLPACRSAVHHDPVRAVWVTRFDYASEADVERAITRCADLGFNTVMFQVRGNGTAFYESSFEPRAEELAAADPDFDPLAVAVEAAHARDVSLHAWTNVMPSWRGTAPPKDPGQLYLARPEWHWYDQHGVRQPLTSFYVSLNPCLPEVRDHLVATLGEIVEEYDVDGLHLDYVRFVDDVVDPALDYPRDERTLALYREATGKAPDDDLAAWRAWKAGCVTELVAALAEAVADANDDAWLSAAVGGAPEGPQDRHQRDSGRWADERLLDAVFPMNYTADLDLFRTRTAAWRTKQDAVRVVTGVNLPLDRDLGLIEAELRDALAKSRDVCVFAYAYLFDPASGGTESDRAARAARRDLVRRYLAAAPLP